MGKEATESAGTAAWPSPAEGAAAKRAATGVSEPCIVGTPTVAVVRMLAAVAAGVIGAVRPAAERVPVAELSVVWMMMKHRMIRC